MSSHKKLDTKALGGDPSIDDPFVASPKWTKWKEEEKHESLGHWVSAALLFGQPNLQGAGGQNRSLCPHHAPQNQSHDPSPGLTYKKVKIMSFLVNSSVSFNDLQYLIKKKTMSIHKKYF